MFSKVHAMMLVAILCVLYLSTVEAEWRKEDTKRQTAYYILHTVDWLQTRYIATHPSQYSEVNPFIGEHPTIQQVDQYMLTSAIAHYLVMKRLKPRYRKWAQYMTIGMKSGLVNHNYRVGIKFQF